MKNGYNNFMKRQRILKITKNVITILFLIVAGIYFYKSLSSSIHKVMQEEFTLNWWFFFLSILIYLIYFVTLASLWHYVTRLNQSSIPYTEAIPCYAYSVLGKYIPGEIFMLIARFPAYERRGIKARKVTVNFYLENLCTLLGAASLFLVSLLLFKNDIIDDYKWFILVGFILLIVIINPKCINLILRIPEHFMKSKGLQIQFSYFQMLKLVAMFMANWILVGSGFYLLVCSVIYVSPSKFLYVGGVFGLAVMLGMITFFAPSGLGIREGIITMGLSVIIPKEQAVIIALLARLWATLAEFTFIFGVYLFHKIAVWRGRIRPTRILRIRKKYKRRLLLRVQQRHKMKKQGK